jgi:hypothetical protein
MACFLDDDDGFIASWKVIYLYCDVHAVGNMASVDNRCYGNG